ncbi:hypothetical protein [Chloracidobacterium aggregatum]|uniref:hypothetical protein n=1 Tax=Chloracidobacterium aggregatum TaxID=2851959 RepID=UPI0020171496|nr:hypothetical protein [Chloracidobacterium aggregatum]
MPSTGPIRLLVNVLAIVGPVSTTESVENQRQVIRTMVVEVSPDANGKMVARVISDEPRRQRHVWRGCHSDDACPTPL